MKVTHQALVGHQQDVTAWQFTSSAPMPSWVRRASIRPVGDMGWAGTGNRGEVATAREGDWAVTDGVTCVILTDSEFRSLFRPLCQK